MGDPYVDPRTGVLRNRLGITDEDELRAAEADITAAALFQLEVSPHLGEGHFDFVHLRALHVHLFGEIYSWAGKPRTVDIARGSWFCLARNIDEFAASVFRELAGENYLVGLDRPDLVKRVAALYGQLNALHPFREGNGRTQRAFLTQLGRLGGWRLDWARLDRDANVEASRRSLEAGDDDSLVEIVDALLTEEPAPSVPTGVRRRVVLVAPQVAAVIPGGVEDLRRGPYPAEVVCVVCDTEFPLEAEPAVVLLRPLPPPDPAWIAYGHATCSRSGVLPPPSAREIRVWRETREREGDDATGIAILLKKTPPVPAFAWCPDATVLSQAGDDVVDVFMDVATRLGLQLSSRFDPPEDVTPGWRVVVRPATSEVTVVDPHGVRAFAGHGLDLPPSWVRAVRESGSCVLYAVSRGELDPDGLVVAARQGRVASGRAEATVAGD